MPGLVWCAAVRGALGGELMGALVVGPIYETVRVLAVLKAQHYAVDHAMAMLMSREIELERAGLLKREEMFLPSQSGHIWDAVVAGNVTIVKIEAGCGVIA